MKIHQFDPEIYPFKIWVCISSSSTEADKHFLDARTDKEFENIELSMFEAYTCYVRNKENRFFGAVIVFKAKKYMTHKNIAHEASHAAKFLFEHIDADIKQHEPFEYALGWIVEQIYKVKKWK